MIHIFYEHAFRREKIKDEIINISKQINKHLMSLLLYKKYPLKLNHWKEEIIEWIYDVSFMKFKGNNKPLKSNDYFDSFYNSYFSPPDEKEYIEGLIIINKNKYSELEQVKLDIDETENKFKQFYIELSEKMSKKLIFNEILPLINKYFD